MNPEAFIFAFLLVWILGTLALTLIPLVTAAKRRAWRVLATVMAALVGGHATFSWWWTANVTHFWPGLVLYSVFAPALPIFLWRFVRIASQPRSE